MVEVQQSTEINDETDSLIPRKKDVEDIIKKIRLTQNIVVGWVFDRVVQLPYDKLVDSLSDLREQNK
jgi:hypothetical protein